MHESSPSKVNPQEWTQESKREANHDRETMRERQSHDLQWKKEEERKEKKERIFEKEHWKRVMAAKADQNKFSKYYICQIVLLSLIYWLKIYIK